MSGMRRPPPVVVERVVKRYASVTAVDGVIFSVERADGLAFDAPMGVAISCNVGGGARTRRRASRLEWNE